MKPTDDMSTEERAEFRPMALGEPKSSGPSEAEFCRRNGFKTSALNYLQVRAVCRIHFRGADRLGAEERNIGQSRKWNIFALLCNPAIFLPFLTIDSCASRNFCLQ